MGVVNVTPDSFSGDGLLNADDAIAHALEQHAGSADLLDIGAQSTRPGYTPISATTERERLLPVVQGVRARIHDAIVSVDTFDASVLQAACEAGADILNSIWGLSSELLEVVLERETPVIIMHNKEAPVYERDVVEEVLVRLNESAQFAARRGVPEERIILDPGIGFGKLPEHNLAILHSLDRIVALGFPTLLGTSRKSTIGKLTGKEPHERIFGTAATIALAIAAGVDIVRVHDVRAMRDVITVSDAIERGWRPDGWT
ncbi:MAG: dihydropteroate synthase [Candidatus Eremiobacteraeota bacterium]|nr:dihydropteroate synthase [Candidatus Eremiobacteraeota bacterium]MBV9737151.1 dihydropteroate synthase [Candidatus Eremiobacteraeota bacterium]